MSTVSSISRRTTLTKYLIEQQREHQNLPADLRLHLIGRRPDIVAARFGEHVLLTVNQKARPSGLTVGRT